MNTEARIPVFDVGDTLLPDDRLMNEAVEQVLSEHGYPQDDIPNFPIYQYNVFKPEEIHQFLISNDLEANPAEIADAYKERAQKFLADSEAMETLLRCNTELGRIGFISDNSVEEKEFMQQVLRQHYVDYEGYVVSEEVGAGKPSGDIFLAFLDIRDAGGERFAYFGNNARVDQGCEKVGMKFVWVTQYNTFGSSWSGEKIRELSFENIRKAVQQVEQTGGKNEYTSR